jgi:hypothetical protein
MSLGAHVPPVRAPLDLTDMTASAEVIELDQFRRIRDAVNALAAMRSPVVREAQPLQALNWYLPGFVQGARVSTVFGDLPVEALRLRDEVRTYSGASARVQAVDQVHLDQGFLRRNAAALPIRIPANALGAGKPSGDLLVSPGQEVCLNAHIAAAFHKASSLQSRFRMDLTYSTGLTYFRFHFGVPAVVQVEGVWVRVVPWE